MGSIPMLITIEQQRSTQQPEEGIIMTTFEEVRENLDDILDRCAGLVPADLTMKYVKAQGPASLEDGAEGRTFSVSGPKADKVRTLIFADLGLTRKQIAELVDCSVSRVSEVVWGLEANEVEFPIIPLRAEKPATPKADVPAANMPRE